MIDSTLSDFRTSGLVRPFPTRGKDRMGASKSSQLHDFKSPPPQLSPVGGYRMHTSFSVLPGWRRTTACLNLTIAARARWKFGINLEKAVITAKTPSTPRKTSASKRTPAHPLGLRGKRRNTVTTQEVVAYHRTSPFPLAGGRLGWGSKGGETEISGLFRHSTPIPAFPLQGGRSKTPPP